MEHITTAAESKHSLIEDVFAIAIGTISVSVGVYLFQQAELMLGGVAGIALLANYVTGWKFGLLFFVINIPFYFFGIGGMGWRYIVRTFCAVAGMSLLVPALPGLLVITTIHPGFAGLAGGSMIGLGLLVLFRHGAGLGGINILVYWLQNKHNFRAGYVQLGIDALILTAAAFVIDIEQLLWSIAGAIIFNLILGINHKPGRYMGAS